MEKIVKPSTKPTNMEYKTGQAVKFKGALWFITHLSATGGVDLQSLYGQFELTVASKICPATEAEILAEAEKHGCVKKDYYEYNFNGFEFYKSPFTGWVLLKYVPVETETLRQFCNDGLFVDRLITALNLAND